MAVRQVAVKLEETGEFGSVFGPHFDPDVHTTNDVVREAIIPATRAEACAMASGAAATALAGPRGHHRFTIHRQKAMDAEFARNRWPGWLQIDVDFAMDGTIPPPQGRSIGKGS